MLQTSHVFQKVEKTALKYQQLENFFFKKSIKLSKFKFAKRSKMTKNSCFWVFFGKMWSKSPQTGAPKFFFHFCKKNVSILSFRISKTYKSETFSPSHFCENVAFLEAIILWPFSTFFWLRKKFFRNFRHETFGARFSEIFPKKNFCVFWHETFGAQIFEKSRKNTKKRGQKGRFRGGRSALQVRLNRLG